VAPGLGGGDGKAGRGKGRRRKKATALLLRWRHLSCRVQQPERPKLRPGASPATSTTSLGLSPGLSIKPLSRRRRRRGFNQRFEEASELVVAWPCTPALGIRKGSAHRKLLQCDVEVMSSEIFSSSYYDNLKRMRVRHYMLVLRGGGTGV